MKRSHWTTTATVEGWQHLADKVRDEMAYTFKCDSVRRFSGVVDIPLRTLERVMSAEPVSMSTLVKLDITFKWAPGTALRTVQELTAEKPKLDGENEEKLWKALNDISVLTPRDRLAFLHTFRRHREGSKSEEQIS